MPSEILQREKHGFGVPLRQWFRDDLRELVRDRLLSRQGDAHRLFNREFVGGMVQEHERGGWDWSVQL